MLSAADDQAAACVPEKFSSRVCERGTKGCEVQHVSSAATYPVWSRITWYWIGVVLGTCLGVTLGYLLTIGGVL